MGAGGSCRRNKDPTIDLSLKPFDAGIAESYKENEIREIKVTDNFSVLVSQVEGKFYAYGSKCPHYGAPFVKGVLVDGIIRCPWHGACFDVKTGDIEDSPGFENIPTYRITQGKGGQLTVYPSNYGVYKVERPLGSTKDVKRITIIIGGGAAAFVFAQTLRELNYEGRILMLCKDSFLPYDRTKLSKSPGISWEEIKLKDERWYKEAQIEVVLNATVEEVDLKRKALFLRGEEPAIKYDQLLIASGCKPKLPTPSVAGVQGTNLKNVLTLYNLKDSARIKEKTAGKNVVIMGSGFIAMELAASLPTHCKSITIIGRHKRPYGIVLGETVGRIVQQHIVSKPNVKFRGGDEVKKIIPNGKGEVAEVVTLKEKKYPCDVLIYAIGGEPNTSMFDDCDEEPFLNRLDTGYIPVNEHMQTNIDDVYAAGDCARIPLDCSVTRWASVGHWGIAQKSGRIAAMSMMGMKEAINTTIPFFWHNVGGLSIRYAGYGANYDESLIFGQLDKKKFCVLYRRDKKILACCTCNCDPIAARMTFDIQDDIEWETYPTYIMEVFPVPPIIGGKLDLEVCECHDKSPGPEFNFNPITGDTTFGMKFTEEDRIVEWDANQQRDNKTTWLDRRAKTFDNDEYSDREFPQGVAVPLKKKPKNMAAIMVPPRRDYEQEREPVTAIFNYPEQKVYKPYDGDHVLPPYKFKPTGDIERRHQ